MLPVALGFDFDHTLGVDNKLEQAAFVRSLWRESVAASPIRDEHTAMVTGEPHSTAAIDDELAAASIDREIALYRSGKCSLEEAFRRAFESALGVEPKAAAFETFRELAVSMVPEYVRATPGVNDLLQQLDDASIPYALLTNGWNPLQQHKADSIGFTKPVFVSDDLGARKPSVFAFNVLRDCFALDPQRIWYVGDDPLVDVVGALGAGMRAIWFNGEGRGYPTNIPAPTAIVRNITDVLSFVL